MSAPTTPVPAGRSGSASTGPPTGTGTLGVTVLVISLGVLFAAALVAYVAARSGRIGAAGGQELERVALPLWFWLSTFVVLLSSVVLHYAMVSARVDHPRRAGNALRATAALGVLFLLLQIPGFVGLIESHRALAPRNVLVYGFVLVLAALHAAHVIGGLAPLTSMARSARGRPLGADRYGEVRRLSIYWHFLSVVWLVMFNTFLLA